MGKIYAQRYFPPEAKARAQAMVANLIAAFRKRIDALTWMDPATKAEAQAKLTTLYVGVGYPETWKDYSEYEVKADDIFGNVWRGRIFDYQKDVARLGKPVDRTRVVNDAADRECGESAFAKCPEFSGGHPAATVF